ncbi:hypothetical protein A3K73_00005 [Candidatus Pacearchaeota archaeon RBG_13_36_9]|nr:MAG: hypothetical protein A3K73_00005 [Candidatus Pacearchaeota archaeon RBG_13_36_9]
MGVDSLITGFYAWGSDIGTILQDWEYMGVFEYVLPFVLLFAVIFGILHKSQIIGDHRGVNMVIALAVAGLAITSLEFRSFFRVIFPSAGVGLAILLVGMIMVGLFIKWDDDKEKWARYVFYGIGMFVAVVIALSALSSYEVFFASTWWWQQYMNSIIVFAVIVGLILLVVLSVKKKG